MAEGLLRHLGAERFEAYSAGTEATHVRPLAIKTMQELGIDITGQQSKTLECLRDEDTWPPEDAAPTNLRLTPSPTSCGTCQQVVGVLRLVEIVPPDGAVSQPVESCPSCTCRLCARRLRPSERAARANVCKECLRPKRAGGDEQDPLYTVPCAACTSSLFRCLRELDALGSGHWPTNRCDGCGDERTYHMAIAPDASCSLCSDEWEDVSWAPDYDDYSPDDSEDDEAIEVVSLDLLPEGTI